MIVFCSISFVCFLSLVQCQSMTHVTPDQLTTIRKQCGIQKSSGTASGTHKNFKVLHGKDAAAGQFPWTAQIVVHKLIIRMFKHNNTIVSSEKEYILCGGSMISPKHIITAAHCLFDTIEYLNPNGNPIGKQDIRVGDVPPYTVARSSINVVYYIPVVGSRPKYVPVTVRAIFTIADPLNKEHIFGEDYAFLETDIPPVMHLMKGDIRPICMTDEPKQHSSSFKKMRTLAGFGGFEAVEPRLRWLDDIEAKDCTDPDLTPHTLLKCYRYEGKPEPGVISQVGDSGGGFIVWHKDTHRAYLDAVLGGQAKSITQMFGINVPETKQDPRSPLHKAQEKLGLQYQTLT